MKRRRITEKLDEIIAFSGIEHHIDTPVKRYTSGMYVRLAFAVAAHLDSDILIADEVLAVGDAEFQKKALGKMQDLSTGQGRTVLFVSHNMGAVKNLCNCGFTLTKGELKETSRNIDTLVSDYLNNFEKPKHVYKWVNNGDFSDPYFIPISLELQEEDGQSISGEISAEKGYRVKLVFEIREYNPVIEFYFYFFDINSTLLFVTGPQDTDFKKKLGTNTVFCFIPPNSFNIHEYVVSVGSAIHQIKWIVDPYTYTISIGMNVTYRRNIPVSVNTPMAPPVKWYSE
jgi:lipopolysaccharide transport system ATP-binding protein